MLNFLISLIIASQLVVPLSGVVLGASTVDEDWPRRKITGSFEPVLNSQSALALDVESGKILFQKQGFEQRSVASITKLMTALVFLEQNPDWDKNVEIIEDDKEDGGTVVVRPGEVVNLRDLFKITLIGSVNAAANSLAQSTDLSYKEFIQRMNNKAGELGLKQTYFADATGLSSANQSTAMEVARLLQVALKDSLIRETLQRENYIFWAVTGQRHVVKNTNQLLKSYLDVEGGKTGYIDEAGFCVANLIKSQEVEQGILVVILGARSEEERFQENKFLGQWVLDNWEWK